MEDIYKPRTKTNEPFDLNKFEEFQNKLNPFLTSSNNSLENIFLNMEKEISTESIDCVLNANLKEITEPYFLHKIKEIPVPDVANGLKCVRRALSHTKRTRNLADRIQRATMIQLPPNEVKGLDTANNLNEIIFVVKVFEPFKYVTGARKTPKIGQEIRVLGSHNLTVLRDNIRCYDAPLLDVSENPSQDIPVQGHNSSFIFVDDTFYVDRRHPQNLDYSEVIRNWASKKKYFRTLNNETMENTFIKDLKFKIGFPYVFQHFGNCEHLIMFTDVRLVTRKEINQRIGFPMVLNGPTKHVYCFVCGLNEAMFVIQGSKEHIQDPSQLCNHCLFTFHYKDGKKIGDFTVYRVNNDTK